MRVFQCVTTCSLVTFQWNFKGISRLYRHSFILKVKAAGPSETSENFSQNTRRHITKYWKLLSHCLGNFRFHVVGCGCCLFVCFFFLVFPILRDEKSQVRIPWGGKKVYLYQNVQTGSVPHPAFCSMDTGGYNAR